MKGVLLLIADFLGTGIWESVRITVPPNVQTLFATDYLYFWTRVINKRFPQHTSLQSLLKEEFRDDSSSLPILYFQTKSHTVIDPATIP
jgi:hypothetical protein